MCGIAGVISKDISACFDDVLVMSEKLLHRGRDGVGFYTNDNNVAFSHRRLAIIDPVEASNQPMIGRDGSVIIFNGEIYNYRDLRKYILLEDNEPFLTESDTEVFLRSYRLWGRDCLQRLQGMWSCAIYDKERDEVFFSRDRFGIKPFYYTLNDNKFRFASEPKALVSPIPNLNRELAFEYLVSGFVDHTVDSLFDGIKKLSPGHFAVISLKTFQYIEEAYYRWPQEEQSGGEKTLPFEQGLKNSISSHLVSDVGVGGCLSGGIDSSLLTLLASADYDGYTAITAGSSMPEQDESATAGATVNIGTNIDHNVVYPSKDEFWRDVDHLVYLQDEPFCSPSIYMQYSVYKEANRLGLKVMIDGQGGDEIFLGYDRYWGSVAIALIRAGSWKKAFLYSWFSICKLKFMALGYLVGMLVPSLRACSAKMKLPLRSQWKSRTLKPFAEVSKNYSNVRKLQEKEITSLNLQALLRYSDRGAMANGVESRLPYLDHNLVHGVLSRSVDPGINVRWSKYNLRRWLDDLGANKVAWKKDKLSFNAPDEKWFEGKFDDMWLEVSSSSILPMFFDMKKLEKTFYDLSNQNVWRLYNFSVWERIYNVKY